MDAQPSECDRRRESEQTQANPPAQNPLGHEKEINGVVGANPADHGKSNNASYDKGGIPRKWEIRIAAFLALVNFAALIIYAYQLREMRKATKAATDALAFTRSMSHLDQRAWVGFDSITGTPTLDKRFDISVTVKNSGKTFATNVKSVVYFDNLPLTGLQTLPLSANWILNRMQVIRS